MSDSITRLRGVVEAIGKDGYEGSPEDLNKESFSKARFVVVDAPR